jgi:hypothetical protein
MFTVFASVNLKGIYQLDDPGIDNIINTKTKLNSMA